MSFHFQKPQNAFVVLFFVSTIVLSACAPIVKAEQVDPSPVVIIPESEEMIPQDTSDDGSQNEEATIVSHEKARDIAVAYLVEKYTLEAPKEWFTEDQIPEGLLGASDFLSTSDAWVVRITAPVVAPEYLVYSIEIDNIANGLRLIAVSYSSCM